MRTLFTALTLLCSSLWAGPLAGKRVASFTLPDSQGRYHDVLDYRGKVLLIDIMKTDCPHCIPFARTLEKARERYGDRIRILAIVNPPDNQQTVASFVARQKVSYPILFDFGQAVAAMLQITPQNPTIKLPTLLIVDPEGIIREDLVYDETRKNVFEGDGLFRILDKLLAETSSGRSGRK